MKRNVDFNQLRLNLQTTHNDLVELLNETFDPEHERIQISPARAQELKKLMLDLHKHIAILMCMYADVPTLVDNISYKARLLHTEFLD